MGYGSLKNPKAWLAFAIMFVAVSFGLRAASENDVPLIGDLSNNVR